MADSSIAARLKETHPLYQQLSPDWEFYVDSYQGGDTYTRKSAYLFRHARETEHDYGDRLNRATFTNLVRKQVDIYSSFIFKEPIERQTDDALFREFENDADRKGTPLSQIMAEQVGKVGMIQGHTVTIVDLPSDATKSKTRRQDRTLGIRPYLRVYSPLEVVDWAIDANGSYLWVRVCETAADTSAPFASRVTPTKIYRTWTRTEFIVHNEDGQELDRGDHGLGEVPAVFTPAKEHLQYLEVGESVVVDTSILNRAIYNYQSLLDEFLYRQAFNILALPIDGETTPEKIKSLTQALGTQKGLFFPAGTSPPSYITPPSNPAEIIMQRIEDAHRELIEMAKLQDRKSTSSEKSGIAHAYEFHESNSAFAKIAKNLEDGERKIIRLFYKWMNKDEVPVSITYPTDFNVTTLADTIDESLGLFSLNVSPTFNRLVKKRVVDETFPGLDEATDTKIDEEIDTTPDDNQLEQALTKSFSQASEAVAGRDTQATISPAA